MLISFTVGNFRSFDKPVTLHMEAGSLRKPEKEDTNLIHARKDLTLLNAAAIYGANASGKSNLIIAMRFMQNMVLNSFKNTQVGEEISVEPFLLKKDPEKKPSHFEISLLLDKAIYTYGFKVTHAKIVEEWLYKNIERETPLFRRKGSKFEQINRKSFKEGVGKDKLTRENALFLSTVAQFAGQVSGMLVEAIKSISILQGNNPESFNDTTVEFLVANRYPVEINRFLCDLDLSIRNIEIQTVTRYKPRSYLDIFRDVPAKSYNESIVQTSHKGSGINHVLLDMEHNESHGTQKLFALAGPIVDALMNGKTLIIDEFESRLHPLLTIELIKLFRKDGSNKKNAQLIFTTHDSNLLSKRFDLFRRDQIWFTEKRKDESTDLYSLMEFSPRGDVALDLNYLRGKYGAIPFLSGLSSLLGKHDG